MAKQLTKLKSALKKLNSFSKCTHPTETASVTASPTRSAAGEQLHPVHVGKSKRLYLVTADVISSPIFRKLIVDESDSIMTVGCEVVLFEHLLWMLQNAEPEESHYELAEYYSCSPATDVAISNNRSEITN